MKLKKFSVNYHDIIHSDATVIAKTKKEAIKKVQEVLGKTIEIDEVWEIENKRI